jgi:adenylate cyclase class 1
VFYRLHDGWAELYVLDEYNALWQQRLPLHDETPVAAAATFSALDGDAPRRPTATGEPAAGLAGDPYCQLLPSGWARRAASSHAGAAGRPHQPYYEVQAIVQAVRARCMSRCIAISRSFPSWSMATSCMPWSPGRSWPAPQRRRYRCYITDLDLSDLLGDDPGSTSLYLRYKRELEQA